MHVHHAEMMISAVSPKQYPAPDVPEVALAGRSNVGKSSFINRMIDRKGLARTSTQPGKTQTLNFYDINQEFRFVDVPGYGYARVSKSQRVQFEQMVRQYVLQRENLELLFLLMDFRHEPTALDKQMKDLAEEADIPYAIILTKVDKVKRNQWNRHFQLYEKALDLPTVDALFPFSSVTGEGKEDIWEVIEAYVFDEED